MARWVTGKVQGRGEGKGGGGTARWCSRRHITKEMSGQAMWMEWHTDLVLKGDCIMYRIECLTGSLALNYGEWGFI